MVQPLRPLLAAVSSTLLHKPVTADIPLAAPVGLMRQASEPGHGPFVTISREAGAGGHTLMNLLIGHLQRMSDGSPAWAGYDQQSLEALSEPHALHPPRAELMETEEPGWLARVFEGLDPQVDQEQNAHQVYRRVVRTMRKLARQGRCVVVGRGAAMATADMPGGLHIRLVAPLDVRVANLARQRTMSPAHAAAEVEHLDKARDHFYKRYWGIDPVGAEHFHATLNTARLSEQELVSAILSLVHHKTTGLHHADAPASTATNNHRPAVVQAG